LSSSGVSEKNIFSLNSSMNLLFLIGCKE
jgi:hypothetical protein